MPPSNTRAWESLNIAGEQLANLDYAIKDQLDEALDVIVATQFQFELAATPETRAVDRFLQGLSLALSRARDALAFTAMAGKAANDEVAASEDTDTVTVVGAQL